MDAFRLTAPRALGRGGSLHVLRRSLLGERTKYETLETVSGICIVYVLIAKVPILFFVFYLYNMFLSLLLWKYAPISHFWSCRLSGIRQPSVIVQDAACRSYVLLPAEPLRYPNPVFMRVDQTTPHVSVVPPTATRVPFSFTSRWDVVRFLVKQQYIPERHHTPTASPLNLLQLVCAGYRHG